MITGRRNQTAWGWRSGLLLSLHLLLPSVAHAALAVTPPQLHPDETGIVVTEVQSSLAGPSKWSVRMVRWPADGSEPTPVEARISPRFFTLTPGGRQMIRAQVRDRSVYHRLLVEQIPEGDTTSQGLAFRFRFSLPVYRQAQEPQPLAPAIPLVAGCHAFENPASLAVRLILSPDVQGPQTLLPGERAELCRRAQTASHP